MSNKNKAYSILYSLLPVILYVLVYQIAACIMLIVIQVISSGNIEVQSFVYSHEEDMEAMMTAIAMAAGFIAIHRLIRKEVSYSYFIKSGKQITAVSFIFIVLAAILLNIVISASGMISADSAAGKASEQTGGVSILLGILVYGILSPFIEESVFRGITFERIQNSTASFWQATFISSLLFGLYHGNLIQGVYAFFMGILFCLFCNLTGSLPCTVILHGVINVILLILSQSGMFGILCEPVWFACLLGGAILCAGFLYIQKRDRTKNE